MVGGCLQGHCLDEIVTRDKASFLYVMADKIPLSISQYEARPPSCDVITEEDVCEVITMEDVCVYHRDKNSFP